MKNVIVLLLLMCPGYLANVQQAGNKKEVKKQEGISTGSQRF